MKFNNILGAIGNTPVIRLSKLFPNHQVWIKLEKSNPGGSIKDRIALAMIEKAEREGIINKDTIIIEPTSGNTGVGLALVAAVKGYKLVLVMPESMSVERRKLVSAYGAYFVLTPKEKGTGGAVEKAKELAASIPNSWIPQQFENPANPEIHRLTTAQEILNDFPNGVDYFISGIGTGGHLSGIGEVLKEKFPHTKVLGIEPAGSPVLSGGKPGPHPLQGIGTGFIPKTLNTSIYDGIITIEKDEAYEYTKRLVRTEGILAGISTGTSLAAIAKKLPEIKENEVVLTVNYDSGDRYWSVADLFEENPFTE